MNRTKQELISFDNDNWKLLIRGFWMGLEMGGGHMYI